MASGLVDNTTNEDLHVQTEDMNTKLKKEKVRNYIIISMSNKHTCLWNHPSNLCIQDKLLNG